MEHKIWLVYSIEHNGWWKPGDCGYTQDINQAARYTEAEANERCKEPKNEFAMVDHVALIKLLTPRS